MSGETGSPVGPYPKDFPFTGEILRVNATTRPDQHEHTEKIAEGQLRGALEHDD